MSEDFNADFNPTAKTDCGINTQYLDQVIYPELLDQSAEIKEIEHHLHNYEKWFDSSTSDGEYIC